MNQEDTDEHDGQGKPKDEQAPGKGPDAKQADAKSTKKKEGGDLTQAETRATGLSVTSAYCQCIFI